MTYLNITDLGATKDMEVKPKPENLPYTYLCPKCRGYGGWHLKLDAYGPGEHFNCFCDQCNGWGWVPERDSKCVHECVELTQEECREAGISHFGMCYHVEKCTKCNRIRSYDSSD